MSTDLSSVFQDSCSQMDRCSTCVARPECGFCYQAEDLPSSAHCLPTNPSNPFESWTGSACQNGTTDRWVWSNTWCPSLYPWVTLFGLCLYLFSFAPGMGPMPWTINAELYPLWARGTCTSITTSVNWLFNLVTSLTFLTVTEVLSPYGTFWLFFVFGAVGWIVLFFFLPETKNKSMEDDVYKSDHIPISFGH